MFFLIAFAQISGLWIVSFCSQSGLALLPNGVTVPNTDDQVLEMIVKQAHLCPYVSLCTKPNTSVYIKPLHGSLEQCCQTCSCDFSCIGSGNCCPDFNKNSSDVYLNNTWSSIKMDNATFGERKTCVKTHNGRLQSKIGYAMITTCPDDFLDGVIKRQCESKFEFSDDDIKKLFNHIPVSDTNTGHTYKNRHCEFCNSVKNSSIVPWDMWMHCVDVGLFIFPYYVIQDPVEFAVSAILHKKMQCNLAFHLNISKMGSSFQLQSCEADDAIESCSENNSDPTIRTICKQYTWPIMSWPRIKYKNYACMLCNGQTFKEYCKQPSRMEIAMSLMTNTTAMVLHQNEDSPAQTSKGHEIARYFPNRDGYVHCRKGFFHDNKKNRCRHVLCPMYFFAKNGECVQVFGILKNIYYKVVFEVFAPVSLKEAQQSDVENGIWASIDNIFREGVGIGNFDIYLWSSQTMPGEIQNTQPYVIAAAIAGHIYGGSYAYILEFVNKVLLYGKQNNISVNLQGKPVTVRFDIRFSTTLIWSGWKPYGQNLTFHLIRKSNPGNTVKPEVAKTSIRLDILEASLCYRVNLQQDEFKPDGFGRIRVLSTNTFTTRPKVESMICLNRAFDSAPGSVSNMFLHDNDEIYAGVPWSGVNIPDDEISSSTGADDATSFATSILATLCTFMLVALIFGIQALLRRFVKKNRDVEVELEVRYKNSDGGESVSIRTQHSHAEATVNIQ